MSTKPQSNRTGQQAASPEDVLTDDRPVIDQIFDLMQKADRRRQARQKQEEKFDRTIWGRILARIAD